MRTSNELDNELVKGSSSADTIENSGQYATVQGGSGNDSILNEGDNSYIDGEAGNDTVEAVDNDYVTVYGGAGVDQINGVYYNSSINGGAGNDIVEVELAEVSTVEGGEGADEISGVFVGSEVSGGKGDDLITLQEDEENISQENTVSGGAGNDTIINEVTANYEDEEEVPGNVYQYAAGEGNDVIYGINVNDTLNITSGTISKVEIDEEDAILTIGTGKITLKDAAGKTIWLQKGNNDAEEFTLDEETEPEESDYIELTNGNDTYSNFRDNVTIAALGGKDYIYNDAENVFIDAGAGNDTIKNDTMALDGEDNSENRGDNVTIDGGAGDDSIISCGAEDISINGGAGNDYIGGDLRSSNTITGGKGNDTIVLTSHSGRIIQYENGDGKDIVTGYSEGDEIIIGDDYTTSISGNDWIIKVGSGSITLKDAASQTIIIDGEEIEPEIEPSLPDGWKYGTSSKTNTNTGIITATITTGAEDLDLTQEYGEGVVSVDASKITDGVQITGNDEGNSIKGSKNGADTFITGTGDDSVSLGAGANVADYYVYTGGNDVIYDYGTGKDTIQISLEDMDSISMETLSGDVEIKTSAGTMTLKKASGKDIVLIDANGDTISLPGIETISGTAKVDNITNEKDEVVIDALAGNDKITNSGNNVTIIGGKGNDTITNSGDGTAYQYASGDGKDVIQGFGENDTLFIDASYSYSVSGSDVVVKVGSGSITLKDVETSEIHINNEVIHIETIPEGWNYGNTAKTLFKATVASAEKEIDLNENYGEGVVSVDGSKITSGVQIIGNDEEGNSIKGGKGADEITGGAGNDTVSLGGGKDIYIYQGGDDVIQDYKDGDDTIQIAGNEQDQTVVSSSVKGNDLILYTPNGNITVKDGNKAEQILVVNENGDVIYGNSIVIPEGWKLDSNKKTLSATLKTADTNIDLNEDYGEGIEIVDANKVTSGVEIIANDLSNSVKGTKYDDVISGGDGDDTISLGGGADVYIYSGGDDVIQDYVAGTDSIQIDTVDVEFNIEDVTTVGNDVVITTSAGVLKVLKGKGKDVTIMDADGEQIYPEPVDFPPEGWKLDSQKTKITASSTAEDLDLSIDNNTAAGVKNVDASKVTSGVVIVGNDNENSIKGGKGDDEISGGGGNDTISLGGGKDTYIYAGGDDVIQDYVAGADVIQFNTSNVTFDPETGVSTIGSNVIIATDLGNITVIKGSGKVITVVDENGEQIYPGADPLPAGWKYDSTHKQVKASATSTIEDLDLTNTYGNGVNVVDAASAKTGVNVIGNDDNNSIRGSKLNDTIQGGSGADTVSLGGGADVYIYTGGDDILQDYAAADIIQIDVNDIQISEYKTEGTDFVIYTEAGNLKVTKGATKDVTVVDADGNQIYPSEDTLPAGWKYDSSKTLVTATVTSSADDLDLTQPYGEGVIKVDASKVQTGANIIGNDNDNSIKGGKGDDVIYGGSGNDTVSLGAGADVYVYSGGDDYIHDYATVDAIQIDSNVTFDAVSVNGSDVIYTVDNDGGTLRLKGAKGKAITFIDENGDTINPIDTVGPYPAGWTFASKKATATVKTADAEIDLTEDYGDGIVTVDGSKITSGVEIKGNNLSNSIKGGSGIDTIYGGSGNDTVSLGGGADVYVYTEGDDLIQDYKAGQDVISFENEILSSSVSGTNVIITTDEGKVTVKGMKGKEIEVVDFDGTTYKFTDIIVKDEDTVPAGWKLDSSKKTLTATVASADVEVDLTKSYGATVTKVDASKTKGGVEIYGNDLGNSIKGGSGADTIYGGAGNDTVSLGGGNDLFVYTGGNDLIQDYKAGQDAIQINTTDIDVIEKYDSGANVVVETSEGNITIKGGKGKEISFFDESGDELWFDDDGSFVSANTLDEITALTDDNYSQGKINLGSEADVLNPDDYIAASYEQEKNK